MREAKRFCFVCAGFKARRTLPILHSKSVPNGKAETVTGNVWVECVWLKLNYQQWRNRGSQADVMRGATALAAAHVTHCLQCVCVCVMSEGITLNHFVQQGCDLLCPEKIGFIAKSNTCIYCNFTSLRSSWRKRCLLTKWGANLVSYFKKGDK